MMNLYFLFGTAEFAGICEDSLKEFASVSHKELIPLAKSNVYYRT